MSNSIWKTPDQKPEDYENIAFYVDGYLFTACYKSQYNQYGIFGASKVEKWCYMKELSSYVLALETELEHTRKAVDRAERLQKAVDLALAGLKETMAGCESYDADYVVCERTIKEIEQLIKE